MTAVALKRLKYLIDRNLGTRRNQFLGVVILGCCLILVLGALYSLVNESGSITEGWWEAWTYMADPGTHSEAQTVQQRVLAAVIACVGIVFFSVILGFIVDGVRDKLDRLKRGKTPVVEFNHTLMLGWTDKTMGFIREIALANESEGGGVIVVLATEEKEILEAELRSYYKPSDLLGTKVVFCKGSPLYQNSLAQCSISTARSIVIFAIPGDPDQADAFALRTVLGLKTQCQEGTPIVCEVRDIDNEPLLKIVGGPNVDAVVSHDILGRLMLMSARAPGLAKVYDCLLGFEGDEFYSQEWPELEGNLFQDLSLRFPDATPIGVMTSDGRCLLCPPMNHVLLPGEKVIVIAEDNDSYSVCPSRKIDHGETPKKVSKPRAIEKVLFLGWRRDVRDLLLQLDALVVPGSEVHMMSEVPLADRDRLLMEGGLDFEDLHNLKLVHHQGNAAIRRDILKLPVSSYTSVMIVADAHRELDMMQSDSHTLSSLLLLRRVQTDARNALAGPDAQTSTDPRLSIGFLSAAQGLCPCISEILDTRTLQTVSASQSVSAASDFVQSNLLVSRILAMVSEDRAVKVILDELLGHSGANLQLHPSERYVWPGEVCSFEVIVKRAQKYGEIVCGYQLGGFIKGAETCINPRDKSASRKWEGVDFVVLAQSKERDLSASRAQSPSMRATGRFSTVEKGNSEFQSVTLDDTVHRLSEAPTRSSADTPASPTSPRSPSKYLPGSTGSARRLGRAGSDVITPEQRRPTEVFAISNRPRNSYQAPKPPIRAPPYTDVNGQLLLDMLMLMQPGQSVDSGSAEFRDTMSKTVARMKDEERAVLRRTLATVEKVLDEAEQQKSIASLEDEVSLVTSNQDPALLAPE
mmetsp:Transcript_7715/g.17860  ORF Transcript_7715/g.17860 Transcript_7715/m.17860 type:complete len:863 (+) Transcript_7715:65-2653(+)